MHVMNEIERKWRFSHMPSHLEDSNVPNIDYIDRYVINQTYLSTPEFPNGESRIRWNQRLRKEKDIYTFDIKVKSPISEGSIEISCEISAHRYEELLKYKHPNSQTIIKTRTKFNYLDQIFEYDYFNEELHILELELTSLDQPVTLPPWIPNLMEVPNFSNRKLAIFGLENCGL